MTPSSSVRLSRQAWAILRLLSSGAAPSSVPGRMMGIGPVDGSSKLSGRYGARALNGRDVRTEPAGRRRHRTRHDQPGGGEVPEHRHVRTRRPGPKPGTGHRSQAEGAVQPRHDVAAHGTLHGGALHVGRGVPARGAEADHGQPGGNRQRACQHGRAKSRQDQPDAHHDAAGPDGPPGAEPQHDQPGGGHRQKRSCRHAQQQQPDGRRREVQPVADGGQPRHPGGESEAAGGVGHHHGVPPVRDLRCLDGGGAQEPITRQATLTRAWAFIRTFCPSNTTARSTRAVRASASSAPMAPLTSNTAPASPGSRGVGDQHRLGEAGLVIDDGGRVACPVGHQLHGGTHGEHAVGDDAGELHAGGEGSRSSGWG